MADIQQDIEQAFAQHPIHEIQIGNTIDDIHEDESPSEFRDRVLATLNAEDVADVEVTSVAMDRLPAVSDPRRLVITMKKHDVSPTDIFQAYEDQSVPSLTSQESDDEDEDDDYGDGREIKLCNVEDVEKGIEWLESRLSTVAPGVRQPLSKTLDLLNQWLDSLKQWNVPQEFLQVVAIWPGVSLEDDDIKDFESLFENVRLKFITAVETLPDETGPGGRMDVIFGVHPEDMPRFATARFQYGMRWLEDVYSNGHGHLYPEHFKFFVRPLHVKLDS